MASSIANHVRPIAGCLIACCAQTLGPSGEAFFGHQNDNEVQPCGAELRYLGLGLPLSDRLLPST